MKPKSNIMRKYVLFGLFALSALATGCSGSAYSTAMKDALWEMNELYFTCKKIKKQNEMFGAKRDVIKSHEKLKAIADRLEAIGEDDSAARRREVEKYSIALQALYQKLQMQASRVGAYPKGGDEVNAAVKTIYNRILPVEVQEKVS